MDKITLLWADDEIELLKPHVLFLQQKGYDVTTACSGDEALDLIKEKNFDVVLLDENMPGLSGLETLSRLKTMRSEIPVIMITKSEEEYIMDDAIGSKIADYLIKPVNPNQILLSLKKALDNRRLVSEKTNKKDANNHFLKFIKKPWVNVLTEKTTNRAFALQLVHLELPINDLLLG